MNGSSGGSCGTSATPWSAAARDDHRLLSTASPPTVREPAEGVSTPATMFINTDLPAPFLPMTP